VHSRNVPGVLQAAERFGRGPAAYLREVGAEARARDSLTQLRFGEEILAAAAERAPAVARVEPSEALVSFVAGEMSGRSRPTLEGVCQTLLLKSQQRH